MKTRPSKTKILIRKFISITHTIMYHHQKFKKSFCNAKVNEGPEPNEDSIDRVLFMVLSDGVLFRILSDKVLFRIVKDSVLFRVHGDRVLSSVLSDFLFNSL